MVICLLLGDESENGIRLEARDRELSEGARASSDEHLDHSIELVRWATVAPLHDVYLLPAMRPTYGFGP